MASSTIVPVKVITWEGSLGIDRVTALKEELLAGLEAAQQLVAVSVHARAALAVGLAAFEPAQVAGVAGGDRQPGVG